MDTTNTISPEKVNGINVEIFKDILNTEGMQAASDFLEEMYGDSIPVEIKPTLKEIMNDWSYRMEEDSAKEVPVVTE